MTFFFSVILYAMLLSAIPPTVAHSVALLADDTGRSRPLVAVRSARAQWSVVHKVATHVPLPTTPHTPEHLVVRSRACVVFHGHLLDRPAFRGDSAAIRRRFGGVTAAIR